MILLETKRLIVKSTSPDNLEKIYLLHSDPDVMRYIGVKTREETHEFMVKMIQHQGKHGFSSGNVHEKETGLFVGRSGLIYLEMNDNQSDIEVGYVLHKQFWNKGYATELARAFLEWGFKHLPVSKLLATIHPENRSSRHVVEKLGMSYVGNAHYWGDEITMYEILKADWVTKQGSQDLSDPLLS